MLWLGGSPCSGKSSVGEALAAEYGLRLYSVDTAFERHCRGLTSQTQPHLHAWLSSTCNGRWLQPVDELVDWAISCYAEHFALVLADLLKGDADTPVLVEGTCPLPDCVRPVADDARCIWLVPTTQFQHTHYARRPWVQSALADCDDPAQAFANWMARDVAFADWVKERCNCLGLTCVEVDGNSSIADHCRRLTGHFGLGSA